ncbi:hypothetical protein D3C71_1910260 [compost metagenome]
MPVQLQWVIGQVLQDFGADARFAALAAFSQRFDRGQFVVDFFSRCRQAFVMKRCIERIVQAKLRRLRFVVQLYGLQ